MVIKIKEEKELEEAAGRLLEFHSERRIFAFYGKMGVGKTTFIKSICKVLGVSEVVDSPTFSIVNQYDYNNNDLVYHFDFYRIKNLEEVFDLGYEDYIYSGHYCLIEWPEKMEDLLPDDTIKVMMEEVNEERIIRF